MIGLPAASKGFAISAYADTPQDHIRFKRSGTDGLRGTELYQQWEDRKPPLRPLWKDIVAGVLGAMLVGLVIFWTCIL